MKLKVTIAAILLGLLGANFIIPTPASASIAREACLVLCANNEAFCLEKATAINIAATVACVKAAASDPKFDGAACQKKADKAFAAATKACEKDYAKCAAGCPAE